jgi:hypothetical protein
MVLPRGLRQFQQLAAVDRVLRAVQLERGLYAIGHPCMWQPSSTPVAAEFEKLAGPP